MPAAFRYYVGSTCYKFGEKADKAYGAETVFLLCAVLSQNDSFTKTASFFSFPYVCPEPVLAQ